MIDDIEHIVKDSKADQRIKKKKLCKGLVRFGFVSHRNVYNRS